MEVKNYYPDNMFLQLSVDELGTIGNALNEVCNGIRVHDFAIKMGADRDEVHQILLDIIPVYRKRENLGSSHVVVRFSIRELRSIIAALTTVSREIDEIEFYTRMGAERSEVEQILDQMTPIYHKMKQQQ